MWVLHKARAVIHPIGACAGLALAPRAPWRPTDCAEIDRKQLIAKAKSLNECDHVVWLGGAPAEVALMLSKCGVNLKAPCIIDEEKPIAGVRELVIPRRAWDILRKVKGGEGAATEAIIKLAKDRAEFHKSVDNSSNHSEALGPRLRQVLIIGISGPSCSGKSTVAEALAQRVGSPLVALSADKYFDTARMTLCDQPEFKQMDMLNYEHPEGMSWDVLLDDLKRIAARLSRATHVPDELFLSCPAWFSLASDVVNPDKRGSALGPEPVILILEGFLTFASKEVADLCSWRIFLNVAGDECLKRRWMRDGVRRPDRWEFSPVTPPEFPTPKFEWWFWQVVWAGYQEHISTQRMYGEPWLLVDAGSSSEVVLKQCLCGFDSHFPLRGPDVARV